MLTLTALVVSLTAAPHAASLLHEAPLLGTGILLAQEDGPPPAPGIPATPRTLQELHAERDRLDATRPSLGGPIAMLAVGAGLCLVGAGVGLAGLEFLLSYFFTGGVGGLGSLSTLFTIAGFVLVGIAVVAIAVGIPLAVIGGIRLKKTLAERSLVGVEMNAVDEQIRQLEEVTPPPPPAPTSVERQLGPQPLLVLSSF